MAQIQSFKNSRLVGEDHTGRLQVIERPSGNYGAFVEQTVTAENGDRDTLMRAEAAQPACPLATVETERAQQWRERRFRRVDRAAAGERHLEVGAEEPAARHTARRHRHAAAGHALNAVAVQGSTRPGMFVGAKTLGRSGL